MTDWFIGQKVVCINDKFSDRKFTSDIWPVKGVIYTIRGFDTEPDGPDSVLGLYFEEIVNKPKKYRGCAELVEQNFCSSRFRPLVDTNFKIFTDILETFKNPTKHKVRELEYIQE